jgi:hypothetical protein
MIVSLLLKTTFKDENWLHIAKMFSSVSDIVRIPLGNQNNFNLKSG